MQQGTVVRSTGSWYEVRDKEGEVYRCRLRGKFKLKELKVTNPIAVGDWVRYIIEDPQENTGLITDILPRDNYIVRKSVHKTGHGHLIATNLDQALILATLVLPRTSLGFIDRFLVSAETFRIPAIIIFNKLDLLDEELIAYQDALMEAYEQIGYPCLAISALEDESLDELKALLANKTTLISGHSGVGKSSLINTLVPDLSLRTSEISSFANKGVHTTTFAEMFEIAPDTFLIDTPGIKELGLVDIEASELSHYFPEMRQLLGQCKFHDCQHVHEPKCAIIEAVKREEIALFRYENYLSMLADYDNRR
ncbi:MAG: ribosome small subunit-dependent GTPase A [Thermonemataceae bacterium]